ncbi:hypothetical protein CASFOL_008031 [Castilleja foliolosa]|uniref:NADH dehydrogenase subunit 2 n=1 Tax=Castilleja foliolosa TaxID=1961234 RepID=A0ABD3DXU1_9LAMI
MIKSICNPLFVALIIINNNTFHKPIFYTSVFISPASFASYFKFGCAKLPNTWVGPISVFFFISSTLHLS